MKKKRWYRENTKYVGAHIQKELFHDVKVKAAKDMVTIQNLITMLLAAYTSHESLEEAIEELRTPASYD